MNDEKIKGIIKSKVDELSGLSKKIGGDFDKETIHDLRVTTKALRSFLRLLRTHTHEPGLKMTKAFKHLYQTAGALRDAQLELEKITEQHLHLPKYTGNLSQVIARQKNEWEKCYNEKTFQELGSNINDIRYNNMPVRVLTDFFHTKMATIEEISSAKSPTDAQVHNIRKQAKDIIYVCKLCEKKWDAAHKELEKIPLKQLEDIATDIGDYHDQCMALEHLSSFSGNATEPEEENTINSYCDGEAIVLAEEKIRITGKVRGLISREKK